MAAWLKRFGLHLTAALGATGIFVAAAAVGATQTRQQAAVIAPVATLVGRPNRTPRPIAQASTAPSPEAAPATRPGLAARVAARPERSLAGTVRDVQADSIVVVGIGGRVWRIEPAPGALIRLNGKAAPLNALQAGDSVVILGQAQPGPELRFLAHAITAKSH